MGEKLGTPPRKIWPLCGYAPGFYSGKCCDCGVEFIANKRAHRCLDCAVICANALINACEALATHAQKANDRLRITLWNELRRVGVHQDRAIEIVREAADGSASAMETGTAKTAGLGAKHDSAVAKPDAQSPSA